MQNICIITGCQNKIFNKGKQWCGKHYNRWRRNGNPLVLQQERHGMARSVEYQTWRNMKARCYLPSYIEYQHYGGRGIKVCERWRNSFKNFYEDMGQKPKGKTLDRINTNGDYEPKNCRWATYTEQILSQRLRSTNKTGFKGVQKVRNKFSAHITVNYKVYYLGLFDTAEEASIAFVKKMKQLRV